MIRLRGGEREKIAALVRALCGMELDETKAYLIECRLSGLLRRAGCSSFAELSDKASRPDASQLRAAIVDALTTRETWFFRDPACFDVLEHKILPELVDRKTADAQRGFPRQPIRIWSAGCSTGQEAYSLAMVVSELFAGVDSWPVSILATDISEAALRRAREGSYTQAEVDRGLRASLLRKYATPCERGWRICDELRRMIDFARLNLVEDFRAIGRFDVILCRNVAVYLAPEIREDLFDRLVQAVLPGGALFLGAAETLSGRNRGLERREYLGAMYYQRPASGDSSTVLGPSAPLNRSPSRAPLPRWW